MRKLTRILSLLLLAVWGLATVHCELEDLTGFEFLACCQHSDSAPHQDDDCQQDSCAVVESGLYRIDEQPSSPLMPDLHVLYLLSACEAVLPELHAEAAASMAPSPPPSVLPWQFASRAALSPRAPSLS